MFQELSRKYINWSISCFWKKKKSSRKVCFPNWEQVERVRVLLSSERLNRDEFEAIKRQLEGKELSVWCFVQKDGYAAPVSEANVIDKKSVSFLSRPKEAVREKYFAEDCDLLLDLTVGECLPMKYLLGVSDETFRCGLQKPDYPFYDLEMDMEKGTKPSELLEQILFYLKSIQTKA